MHTQNVQLSRLGDWMRRVIRGKPEPTLVPFTPGDGPLHRAKTDPSEAYAEQAAISQALRERGHPEYPSHTGGPEERARWNGRLNQYAHAISQFVKDNPAHPAAVEYTRAARAPGLTMGNELKTAAHPAVEIANILLALHGKDTRLPKREPLPPPVPAWELVPDEGGGGASIPMAEKVPGPKVPKEAQEDLLEVFAHHGHEGAVQWLKEHHGFTNRSEAYAALRAAANRHKVKLGGRAPRGPQKLAAYGGKGAFNKTHVTGGVSRRDPVTGEGVPFRKRLEGTAVAYHLRQIQRDHPELADLAQRAISEKPLVGGPRGGAEGDAFAQIGAALAKKGDPLAKAHDWANMENNMHFDKHVEDLTRQHVRFNPTHPFETPEEHEWQYWEGVRARVGDGKAFGNSAPPGVAEYRRRMIRDLRAKGHKGSDEELWGKVQAAIHRTREDALDRYYLKTEPLPDWRQTQEAARRLSRGGSPAQVQSLAYKMWRRS